MYSVTCEARPVWGRDEKATVLVYNVIFIYPYSYHMISTTTPPAATIFDQQHYLDLIRSRGALIQNLAPQLKAALNLETALDVGCGVGFFSDILSNCGLIVAAIDARPANIAEARHRYPHLKFSTADIEDPAVLAFGSSDLILCFGLLYHLESPLRAIRHLRALTGKLLLLESMCIPATTPHALLRPEPQANDQSLTNLAFYPSEQCIVDMLYAAGFPTVYRLSRLPDHADFRDTASHHRRRTILCASLLPLHIPELDFIEPRPGNPDPWQKNGAGYGRLAARAKAFAAKPAREQYWAIKRRVLGLRFGNSNILRLPFGGYWLLEASELDHALASNKFETAECIFVNRFLQPGMTVIDAGAHHGLYTVLASRKVGRSGRVLAFEPSARERVRLQKNLRLNRCRNVTLFPVALGSVEGTADLFVVDGSADFCNSLRPPAVQADTQTVRVQVSSLDCLLANIAVSRVDFLKLDIEGGELEALRGATHLLATHRPVLMVEVQDLRTHPWGYPAREIIHCLLQAGYRWYRVTNDGSLLALDTSATAFDGNFVAWPRERQLTV